MIKLPALILGLFCSASAFAVCHAPRPRLVCAEYFKSKVVVTAELIRIKPISDRGGSLEANIYFMRTEKSLRGSIAPEFAVYEANDSGRATLDWKTGQSYLLFLTGFSRQDGGWVLDGCGNSGLLEAAGSALKQIHDISGKRQGMLQVVVGGDWIAWSPPMKGVGVQVQSSEGTYSATTNEQGVAEIYVPPGQYSVAVDDRSVQPFDLTYEDPDKVTINKGSCAQIQFIKSPNHE